MDEEDEDSDSGQQEEDESDRDQVDIDRRVAQMIEDRNRYNHMQHSSSQMLRLLTHLLPGVPPNAQVVELESVSEESGSSSSSSTSSSPTSDETAETPTCVIWAEPIMSCQLPNTPPVRCDDVRRLPPGVRPEDVKNYNSSRGLAGGVTAAATVDIGSHQSCVRPTGQSDTQHSNNSVVTQTNSTNIPPSTLTSHLHNSNAPTGHSCQEHDSNETAGTEVSSFGATHNELNDAMMRISEAANTIRLAREMLSSLNLNRQLNINNHGKDGEPDKSPNGAQEDSQPRGQGSSASTSRIIGNQNTSELSTVAIANEATATIRFPEPILVKELTEPNSEAKAREDGKCVCAASSHSTESEDSGLSKSTLAACPSIDNSKTQQTEMRNNETFDEKRMLWSSNMTRAAYQAARIARFPRIYGPVLRRPLPNSTLKSTTRNQQSTNLASNLQSRSIETPPTDNINQLRRTDNPATTSLSTLPEVSGDSPLNSLNGNLTHASLRSQEAGNLRSRSTLGGHEAQNIGKGLGDLKLDIGIVPPPHAGDGVRFKKPVTLSDVKKALEMVITNLQKTNGWTFNTSNVKDESCVLSKSNANAFSLAQADTINKNIHRANNSEQQNLQAGSPSTTQDIESVTRIEKVRISQSDSPVLVHRTPDPQHSETFDGDERCGSSAGPINMRGDRLQQTPVETENSKSLNVDPAILPSLVHENKTRVTLAQKLSYKVSPRSKTRDNPASPDEPCGILMHDRKSTSPSGVQRDGNKSIGKIRKKVEFADDEISRTEAGDDTRVDNDITMADDLTRTEKDLSSSLPMKLTGSELVISTLTKTIGDVDYLPPREYASEINLESQSQSLATQSEYMYGLSDFSFRDESFRSARVIFRKDRDVTNIKEEIRSTPNLDLNSKISSTDKDKSSNTSYNDAHSESNGMHVEAEDLGPPAETGSNAVNDEQMVSTHTLSESRVLSSPGIEKDVISKALDDETLNSIHSQNKSDDPPQSIKQGKASDMPDRGNVSQDDGGDSVSMISVSVGPSRSHSVLGRPVRRPFLTVHKPRPPRYICTGNSLDVQQKLMTAFTEEAEPPTELSKDKEEVTERATPKGIGLTSNTADLIDYDEEVSEKAVGSVSKDTEKLPSEVQISDKVVKVAYETTALKPKENSISEIMEIRKAYETIPLPHSDNEISETSDMEMKIAYENVALPPSDNEISENMEIEIAYETIALPPSDSEISQKEIIAKPEVLSHKDLKSDFEMDYLASGDKQVPGKEMKSMDKFIEPLPPDIQSSGKDIIPCTTSVVKTLDLDSTSRSKLLEQPPGDYDYKTLEKSISSKAGDGNAEDDISLKTLHLSDTSFSEKVPLSEVADQNREIELYSTYVGPFFKHKTPGKTPPLASEPTIFSKFNGVGGKTEIAAGEVENQMEQGDRTVVVELKRTSSGSFLGKEEFPHDVPQVPTSPVSSNLTASTVSPSRLGTGLRPRLRRIFSCCFRSLKR